MTENVKELKSRGRVGMWLFISTEVLLFGGLFLLYSMYRFKFASDFHASSILLSRLFGTLNTCILITSSLSVALSILMLREDRIKLSLVFLSITIMFAFAFLAVKGFEWGEKFEHGLYPRAPYLMSRPKGEELFFGLYFMMTGLHALHVIVGILVLSFNFVWILRGNLTAKWPVLLVNSGLYWHLVDIIWIFLYPLFYLIT